MASPIKRKKKSNLWLASHHNEDLKRSLPGIDEKNTCPATRLVDSKVNSISWPKIIHWKGKAAMKKRESRRHEGNRQPLDRPFISFSQGWRLLADGRVDLPISCLEDRPSVITIPIFLCPRTQILSYVISVLEKDKGNCWTRSPRYDLYHQEKSISFPIILWH